MTLIAGAAQRDITPPPGRALFGYPHVERIATGTHDPLLASVLVLTAEGPPLVLAALDLLFVSPPAARALRAAVARAVDTLPERVFISCTHTHSGPVTVRFLAWADDPILPEPDAAYLPAVQDALCEAARDARAHSAAAGLAWTTADATGVGGNRHAPDGATDPECGILFVRRVADQRPLAAALVYGMHPTVLHEDSTLYSSDFPHFARAALRDAFGDDLVVLYHTGPSGNQSPRYHVTGQTFAEAERLGRCLGKAVATACADLPAAEFSAAPTLAGMLQAVELPRRPLLEVPAAAAQLKVYQDRYAALQAAGAPGPEVRTAECAVFGAESSLGLARAQADGTIEALLAAYAPLEVQVLAIGETFLVGFPGEIFTEFGLRLKTEAPGRTFVAGLVNGELQGYIVTPDAAAAAGYEATNSLFAPAAGTVLVETALACIRQLTENA